MKLRLLLALPLVLAAGAAGARAPQRIVSLNLCADQYLMALADPSQIVALSRFARDPEMSAGAAQAMRLPITRGGAENVLGLAPDLVMTNPGFPLMAPATGIPTLDLPPAESYGAIVAQVRQVAAAVGHPERGEALVGRMDAALARLSRTAGRGRTAAYYQRRGYLTGTGTLVDEILRRVGLVNLASRLDRPVLSRVSLEEMAVARPDYLIVESATDRIVDQGTEMLHHPILARFKRLRLPQAWTVCGGPSYVLAAESLVRQLEAGR